MTNVSSGDKNIYPRIINADENYYQQKILPFLEFSEICPEHLFSIKWHKNIDHPACDLTFDLQLTLMFDVRFQ